MGGGGVYLTCAAVGMVGINKKGGSPDCQNPICKVSDCRLTGLLRLAPSEPRQALSRVLTGQNLVCLRAVYPRCSHCKPQLDTSMGDRE